MREIKQAPEYVLTGFSKPWENKHQQKNSMILKNKNQ